METRKRYLPISTQTFHTRDDEDNLTIEGYFAVFDSTYQIGDLFSESIAPGAFTDTISGDIRALTNHDTSLVLGRTTAGTLELKEDEHGLWGRILINPKDQDAMNLYSRTQRGDVNQASIGFMIVDEDEEEHDGHVHWTIRKVELFEVSVCTFPAYEETALAARQNDYFTAKKRETQAWRSRMLKKLKGENHGTESTDAQEKA